MEINPNNLHHAYLIVGEKPDSEFLVSSVLKEIGFQEKGNPDFCVYDAESLDIESAREIKEKAREKPFGPKKIFLIKAERITFQAQNALLKTFEEPSEDVHFFILLNAPDLLLPTVLSRLQIIKPENSKNKLSNPKEFINLSLKERIAFSKDFSDSGNSLPVFLDELLSLLKSKGENNKILNRILNVRRFADDPSSQTRLILEHLSLVLD